MQTQTQARMPLRSGKGETAFKQRPHFFLENDLEQAAAECFEQGKIGCMGSQRFFNGENRRLGLLPSKRKSEGMSGLPTKGTPSYTIRIFGFMKLEVKVFIADFRPL